MFDIDQKREEVARLDNVMTEPGFWDDQDKAQKVIKEANEIKRTLEEWEKAQRVVEDALVMLELGEEENDHSLLAEVSENVDELVSIVEKLELNALLSEPYDSHNAILSIHPGAGGTESQDWAQMLLRMYTRWAEDHEYDVQVLDLLPGDEAGIKSATLLISGPNAYGYLKAEKGVHRLVRISPFDASGRRHTSFTSIDVTPEIEDDIAVDIDPNDLRIDTYRASGAGGQHVNKTDSAIRITHLPTGIVVQCQSERSQHSNKESAMKILRSKLVELAEQQRKDKLKEIKGEQSEIGWGNQIRSYVFCPYTMVKDHRTNIEIGNVDSVMDGNIDPFIEGFLRTKA
ncbi:MAG: peptide chain release factor 2 [Firmicutes bacterium]|nr:peptide chain release factor 2 [Bacillota bacterium]